MCGQELSREKIVLPAPEVDPNVEYLAVEGRGAIWEQGSELADLGLRFVFKRSVDDAQTFSHFLGIRVDDKEVGASNYTAESGSVVVTLLPTYLETLSDGEHVMTALFDDGPAVDVSFTVKKAATEPAEGSSESGKTPTNENAATKGAAKAPATGDNLLIVTFPTLLMVAVAAFALSICAYRRRKG